MVEGRRTSVKLDRFTWRCLQEICCHRSITVHDFCTEVKLTMAEYSGFTSALRVAILRHYRDMASSVAAASVPSPSFSETGSDVIGRSFQSFTV